MTIKKTNSKKDSNEKKEQKPKYEKRKMSIKEYIFFLQSRRDYSYKELYDKLIKREEDPEEIKKVLSYMQEEGYQSDERMARNHYKSRKSKKGSKVISFELKNKGISDKIIREVVSELNSTEENVDNAYYIIEKFSKYDLKDFKIKEKALRKILSRGFSYDEAKKAWEKLVKENFEN